MAVAFLLLMNMLLAILVDAYITVKEFSDKADGVITDMARQSRTGVRAASRPRHLPSVQNLVDTLNKWLEQETEDEMQVPVVPVAHQYSTSLADVRRVLHHFLRSEQALNQQAKGVIDPKTADEESENIAKSLLHHYGNVPTGSKMDRLQSQVHPDKNEKRRSRTRRVVLGDNAGDEAKKKDKEVRGRWLKLHCVVLRCGVFGLTICVCLHWLNFGCAEE